jgi:hypothetical protein
MVVAPTTSRTAPTARLGRVVGTGVLAAVVASAAAVGGASFARSAGVTLEVTGGEAIPVPAFASVTLVLSLVGVVVAAGLARWSVHPVRWWLRTTVALTALSLVPPILAAADTATAVTLVVLHLLAAAVVVPAVARALRAPA